MERGRRMRDFHSVRQRKILSSFSRSDFVFFCSRNMYTPFPSTTVAAAAAPHLPPHSVFVSRALSRLLPRAFSSFQSWLQFPWDFLRDPCAQVAAVVEVRRCAGLACFVHPPPSLYLFIRGVKRPFVYYSTKERRAREPSVRPREIETRPRKKEEGRRRRRRKAILKAICFLLRSKVRYFLCLSEERAHVTKLSQATYISADPNERETLT